MRCFSTMQTETEAAKTVLHAFLTSFEETVNRMPVKASAKQTLVRRAGSIHQDIVAASTMDELVGIHHLIHNLGSDAFRLRIMHELASVVPVGVEPTKPGF